MFKKFVVFHTYFLLKFGFGYFWDTLIYIQYIYIYIYIYIQYTLLDILFEKKAKPDSNTKNKAAQCVFERSLNNNNLKTANKYKIN